MPRTRVIVVILLAVLVAGCGQATSGTPGASSPAIPDPTPSADPSTEPATTPTPQPTLSEEKRPPRGQAEIPTLLLPFGQWARTTADDLRVRYAPGTADEPFEATISAGTSLFVDGSSAVDADGFQWFAIFHGAVVGDDGLVQADGGGWVAGGTADGSETYIEFTAGSCPQPPIDPEMFSRLSGWAKQHCDLGSLSGLSGMLVRPMHGPVTPFGYEPVWLRFSGWYLTDPEAAGDPFTGSGWSFQIHFRPGSPTSGLRPGDLVTVSGHLDDPAAGECRVLGQDGGPEPTAGLQQAFQHACRVTFVVDDLEVTGHVDLPAP
jgi:hypothetical protein